MEGPKKVTAESIRTRLKNIQPLVKVGYDTLKDKICALLQKAEEGVSQKTNSHFFLIKIIQLKTEKEKKEEFLDRAFAMLNQEEAKWQSLEGEIGTLSVSSLNKRATTSNDEMVQNVSVICSSQYYHAFEYIQIASKFHPNTFLLFQEFQGFHGLSS